MHAEPAFARSPSVSSLLDATRPLVSDHAVRRFVERIDPRLAYEAARDLIERALETAVRMRGRRNDVALWWVPEPSCLLAVGLDADGNPSVVTVLPPEWQTSGTCRRVFGLDRGRR